MRDPLSIKDIAIIRHVRHMLCLMRVCCGCATACSFSWTVSMYHDRIPVYPAPVNYQIATLSKLSVLPQVLTLQPQVLRHVGLSPRAHLSVFALLLGLPIAASPRRPFTGPLTGQMHTPTPQLRSRMIDSSVTHCLLCGRPPCSLNPTSVVG